MRAVRTIGRPVWGLPARLRGIVARPAIRGECRGDSPRCPFYIGHHARRAPTLDDAHGAARTPAPLGQAPDVAAFEPRRRALERSRNGRNVLHWLRGLLRDAREDPRDLGPHNAQALSRSTHPLLNRPCQRVRGCIARGRILSVVFRGSCVLKRPAVRFSLQRSSPALAPRAARFPSRGPSLFRPPSALRFAHHHRDCTTRPSAVATRISPPPLCPFHNGHRNT